MSLRVQPTIYCLSTNRRVTRIITLQFIQETHIYGLWLNKIFIREHFIIPLNMCKITCLLHLFVEYKIVRENLKTIYVCRVKYDGRGEEG